MTESEQKIERAVRVYSVFPKDKVISALDKKKLTKEEKLVVLQRLGIDPNESTNALAEQYKTHETTINIVSPNEKVQNQKNSNTASVGKKPKKVKKAIKYFKGKDISKAEIEKALESEKFTKEEIEIVLSNI